MSSSHGLFGSLAVDLRTLALLAHAETEALQTDIYETGRRASWDAKDVVTSLFVVGATLGIYLYFSFWLG